LKELRVHGFQTAQNEEMVVIREEKIVSVLEATLIA
jgi:hypothetical protein